MQLIEEREWMVVGAWSTIRWVSEVEGWISPIVYSTYYKAEMVSARGKRGWAVIAASPATNAEKLGFK